MIEKTLEDIVIKIFSEPPKDPCTYNVSILNSPNTTLFQLLMSILISGARYLYGNTITPNDITSNQFDELKCYMESVGYKIKYNYTLLNQNDSDFEDKPRFINIWFEQFIPTINCHGIKI